MIYAKVIADSISPTGSRLTTIEAQYPLFIHAHVLTHRAFSRNGASARAIPTKKVIQQVRENPCIPLQFGSNQPGMQAGPPVEGYDCEGSWRRAALWACDWAEELADAGVHKEIVNRIIAPYRWHTSIITSTEAGWNNFFEQRISPLAQPEICRLAEQINWAMSASKPHELDYGEWHLPYVDQPAYSDRAGDRKISAARCARVSYLTHDGVRDVSKDLELYDRLVSADPPHWSPLEHVATPSLNWLIVDGNFDGWEQLRHLPEFQ